MKERKILFRTSMGGYNKDDVNKYIEEINIKHHENEYNSRKAMAELEKRVNELEEKNKEYEENAQSKLKEFEEGVAKSDKLISELQGTVERLNDEKSSLEKQIEILKNSVLDYEKTSEDNTELYEKSSKYDKVSEQIGSMIVSASARAESIVHEAELKAKVNSTAIIEEVMGKLKSVNDKYINDITTKTVQLTDELRALSLAADSFRQKTKASIESECEEIKASLETKKKIILEDNNG